MNSDNYYKLGIDTKDGKRQFFQIGEVKSLEEARQFVLKQFPNAERVFIQVHPPVQEKASKQFKGDAA